MEKSSPGLRPVCLASPSERITAFRSELQEKLRGVQEETRSEFEDLDHFVREQCFTNFKGHRVTDTIYS